eukprot:TRINITY_DN4336_c0_g1_i1.p1 TRINITY_DN4336_c0_g1~~TRINITY_DN4336_c0_g1_i1.p1  ORF type:complete len:391 (+),score=147.53 TRINITY_DN4336_c0_g1_i1:191-1363(+)
MIYSAPGYSVEGLDSISESNLKEESSENSIFHSKSFQNYDANRLNEEERAKVFDVTDKDNDFLYYRDQILPKSVQNRENVVELLCSDSSKGPFSVSIALDNGSALCLIRTMEQNERVQLNLDQVSVAWWRRLFKSGPSPFEIAAEANKNLPVNKSKRITDPRLPQALLTFEEQQRIKGFKFGILLAKEGQTKEDEMFSNVESSPQFDEFLDFVGERLVLENWRGFKAGFDLKGGTTGKTTIHKRYNNNDILFHVSTLLPFNPKDKQQLERKRHIGNDIVVIVFQEGETIYKPTTLNSRQTHVVILIKPIKLEDKPGETFYRVAVISREGVPSFGPELPKNSIFAKDQTLIDFLYCKLLNAEKACYQAPILNNKLVRARNAMLKDIASNFT